MYVSVYSPTSEPSVGSNYFIRLPFVFPISKKDAVASNAQLTLLTYWHNLTRGINYFHLLEKIQIR